MLEYARGEGSQSQREPEMDKMNWRRWMIVVLVVAVVVLVAAAIIRG